MENNELKKVRIKNRTCYDFDNIIEIEDFKFDNILLDEDHMKIIWFMTFLTKHCLVQNHCVLNLMK